VPLAHASDGGGSIRIPASCCGVFGLKPSRRRMVRGSSDQAGYAVDNCVSRSVRDSAMLFAVAQDSSPDAPLKPIPFVSGPSRRRLRIGLEITDYMGRMPHPDVQQAVENTAQLCTGLAHAVVDVKAPVNGEEFEKHFFALFSARTMALAELAEEKAGRPVSETRLLDRFVYDFGRAGEALADDAVAEAMEYMTALGETYSQWLSSMDVLLTPVVSTPSPKLGYLFDPRLGFDVMSGRVLRFIPYTPVQNALGLPAMSVPLGMGSEGLPIGSHFVAPAGREDVLLALAYELEQAKPWAELWAPNSAKAEAT
jgi:amidase